MKINNFFKGKQLRFADMFFTSEDEDVMNVCVFKNIPVRGDSFDDILKKCIRLIEDGFDSYEWMVNINRKMSVNMGGVHYQDLSSCYFDSLKKKVVMENVLHISLTCLLQICQLNIAELKL